MPHERAQRPWWQDILGALFPPADPFIGGGPFQQHAQAATAPPPRLTPRAFEALATLTPEERARLGPIPEEPLGSVIARRKRAEAEAKAAAAELGKPSPIPARPTQDPPEGFRWSFDRDLNRWIPQFAGLTAQQRTQQEQTEQQRAQQQSQFEAEMAFRQQQFEFQQQPPPTSPFQQQQFGLQQRAQAAQQEQFGAGLQFQQEQALLQADLERQREQARLAANPISWLQYAAFTGQDPVVQPWMIPLGFQGEQLQAGQPLPGFERQEGQDVTQTFTNLPALRTPSAQLQARWGPTAQQQFLGFRQARTGATPEETQFRLGSGRAPTGAFGGFTRFR